MGEDTCVGILDWPYESPKKKATKSLKKTRSKKREMEKGIALKM